MSTFKLRVISAEGRFFDGECESLVFPTLDGKTGILADHCNMLGAVSQGIAEFTTPDGTLLALATSFWANTLNLRDIVSEQTGWSTRLSWLAASAPCLILAFMGLSSFVGFTRFASIIQVVTGLGIILAYNLSRKRVGSSALLGRFGALPFQILIACCSLLATVGAVLPVT